MRISINSFPYLIVSLLILSLLFHNNSYGQHTFSIVAVDPATGEVGSAGATCLESGASIISGLVPGIGAVNSQALVCTPENLNLIKALGMMEDGFLPDEILNSLLEDDVCGAEDENFRQYGIIAFDAAMEVHATAYTGSTADDYANHLTGENFAIQGNILIGAQVLWGMQAGFINTEGTLAEKLMGAMQGANIVGADSRCAPFGTSSAGAFLRVACPPGTADCHDINLDVFFLPEGVEPIDTLQSLFNQYQDGLAFEPPSNDECIEAQEILLAASQDLCEPVSISLSSANESFVPITACEKENVISDVWMKFTTGSEIPAYGIRIDGTYVPIIPGLIDNIGFAVYEACRADAFYKACLSSDNETKYLDLSPNCILPNTEYRLKVWSGESHLFNEAAAMIGVYELHESDAAYVHWGNISGQGDFDGGLNDWTVVAGPTGSEWVWDEDGLFNSLTGASVDSKTKCNGAVVFHSEYYITGGFINNIPPQPYPIFSGELISPTIDLSDAISPELVFNQHFAGLGGNQFQTSEYPSTTRGALLSFSMDNGTSWSIPEPINDDYEANEFGSTTDVKTIQISSLAGSESVKIKFIYDGDFYFWIIDDVFIRDPDYVEIPDTVIMLTDTLYVTDSIFISNMDSLIVSDTILISNNDSSLVTDTVYITNTIYIDLNTSIQELPTSAKLFKLDRNPIQELLRISFLDPTLSKSANIRVFDTGGKEISQAKINIENTSKYSKDLSKMGSGIYFIQVIFENGSKQTERLLKN